MTEQAFFTVGEAAKVTGRGKGTISEAIKSGRLSVHEKTDRGYRIAGSELFRVFPAVRPNGSENGRDEHGRTPETNSPNRGLEREIEALREERDRERRQLQETIDDLRRRLDVEGEERRRLTAMILTDQTRPEPPAAAPEKPAEARSGGWWGKLTGRG